MTSGRASPSCSSRSLGRRARRHRRRSATAAAASGRRSTSIVAVEHDRIVETITAFNPHVVVHIAVWEPHRGPARRRPASSPTTRRRRSSAPPPSAGRSSRSIVRSGIEVYGRARGAPTRPDERADARPDVRLRRDARRASSAPRAPIGRRVGVSVGAIRMGTVLGPHVPSPLGAAAAHAGRAVQRAR